MGRRLGLATTKALVVICGRPIILWQLDALRGVKDIRVVVGYQAGDVIECVRSTRSDAIFVFNHDYQSTGTAASLVAGARGAEELIVSLDGDLVVLPRDLRNFLEISAPALGVLPSVTDEPLCAVLDETGQNVVAFNEQVASPLPTVEWSGLCQLTADQIASSDDTGMGRGNVFELIAPHLPLSAVPIDAREIDSPADFERAEQWLEVHRHEWSSM